MAIIDVASLIVINILELKKLYTPLPYQRHISTDLERKDRVTQLPVMH